MAELEAISRAMLFAEETGCKLHIVHVSSGRGVALVAEARARGVDVTCETCPHYLVLCDEDVERLGAVAKCAPPLRPGAERDALWAELVRGNISLVASDHSPAPPSMKTCSQLLRGLGWHIGLPDAVTSAADRRMGAARCRAHHYRDRDQCQCRASLWTGRQGATGGGRGGGSGAHGSG